MVEPLVIDRNRSGAVRFLKIYFLMLAFFIAFVGFVKGVSAVLAIAVFFVPFGALVALAMLPTFLSKKPWLVLTEREFIYYGNFRKPLSIDWTAIQEIGFKDVKRYRAGDIRMMVLKLKEQGHFIADREVLVSLEWAKVTSFEACYEVVNDYYAAAKKGNS